MQTLDRLLYAWLAEHDDGRFERAFEVYFHAAFPAVVRYLARRAVFDEFQLEDLAQEALLKFFDRIGRRRRRAFATTAESLPQVHPLNLGALHDRQVSAWSKGVGAFASDALQFAMRAGELTGESDWKSILREVSDRAPGLQRHGCHFLRAVQNEMPRQQDTSPCATSGQATQAHGLSDGGCEPDLEELRDFWQHMAETARNQTPTARQAEERHPGVFQFVHATFLVTEAIPQLRIPTNGFLFEIAISLYLDECKSRGRKKRGGSGVSAEFTSGCERHPLEAEDDSESVQADPYEDRRAGFDGEWLPSTALPAHAIAPDLTYEDEQFLEKFYGYLHRPIKQAQAAYAQATTPGAQNAARKRLESVTDKFSRLTGVLSLLGEGHTQEAIAERLNISRNQVKYVVESVQESYVQFCARSAGCAQRTPGTEEAAHVK